MRLKTVAFSRHIALVAFLVCAHSLLAAEASKELGNARLDDIAANSLSFTATDCPATCSGPALTVMVRDTILQKDLKNYKKGDHVTIDVVSGSNETVLQAIRIRSLPVSQAMRFLVLVVAALACFIVTVLVTRFHPLSLIVGQDNRYSNSKFQMALWFGVVVTTYIATVYLRVSQAGWEFLNGVNIPENLLLLSGMSALTFGGAKGITTAKVQEATSAGVTNPKPAAPAPNLLNDLFQNDANRLDFGDFQMIIVTLLAVSVYLVLVGHFLAAIEFRKVVDLPNVDTTILATFGLGHGAYLTKKAVGNVGTS
jgi:hypothetical protein